MSVAVKHPNPEKGKRYVSLLDHALCNGNWADVPELARKVDKHAPERSCLTLAARSEAQIAFASHRPSSASAPGTSSTIALSEAAPQLRSAIEGERNFPTDSYCASSCLAGLYWRQESPSEALVALPKANSSSDVGGETVLGWEEVCAAKGDFIRAAAYETSGNNRDLQLLYRKVTRRTPGSRTPELRRWTERLLARACMYSSRRAQQPTLEILDNALRAFRTWADFWQRSPVPSSDGKSSTQDDIPRRQVWKAYYELLSTILHRELIINSSASHDSDLLSLPYRDHTAERSTESSTRQRSELKRVEATYEALLLSETQFPKASETNTEVERFVERAVSNWKVFCVSKWTDAELGDGGKESITRDMLDILYRAATRTFHSTPILRQLFTVHASIGEFDLAMHAFNSYHDIISQGKTRMDGTGNSEPGLDSDDTAILTAAEAVRVLCRYGDREQGRKALEVSKIIQQWIGPDSPSRAQTHDTNIKIEATVALQPTTLASAYRAIGISHAHWALLTFEPETRSGLQGDAVKNLRAAESFDPTSIQTAYALAKVLAERREVPAAIQVLKKCIANPSQLDDDGDPEDTNEMVEQARQRELIPLWHLLALCLTSRDEYEAASKMCEAAFEQFESPSVLFGQPPYMDITVASKQQERGRAARGLVDQMDSFEKETLIQIKTTQLTFVELMEGATVAVDLTNELLALYTRLFGSLEQHKEMPKPPETALSATPSKIGVNLRSIAGSIRPRTNRNSTEKEGAKQVLNKRLPSGGDESTSATTEGLGIGSPIAITVTNEDGVHTEKTAHSHHHIHPHIPFRHHHDDAGKAEDLHNEKQDTTNSSQASPPGPPPPPPKDTDAVDQAAANANISPQPLKDIPHNIPHDQQPSPTGHDHQPPRQDLRLPAPHPASSAPPEPRFNPLQERQHKTTILVEMWLFIAGLYVRADLHDDARGAFEEAFRLVESFEVEKGLENSNSRTFFFNGWGGGKSVDALWADVLSTKGDLALARGLPFDAASKYEQALFHLPDHSGGIIGISNILMDIYEEKMPAEEPTPPLVPLPASSGPLTLPQRPIQSRPATAKSSIVNVPLIEERSRANKEPTPSELNRLAARDRAYMLLSNLTKLGSGWNDPEAWYTLARSHELSGQVGKAKQALWWVVELEDSKPMRPFHEVAAGGYAL